MKIIRCDERNIDQLLQVALRSIAASQYSDEQIFAWSAGFTETSLKRIMGKDIVLAVDINSVIAGFATLAERGNTEGELDLLYVDPEFSRKGVGKLLVRAIEDEARQREMDSIWVDASSAARYRLLQLGYHVHKANLKTLSGVEFQNTLMTKSFR